MWEIIAAILKPLDPSILLGAIIAGLVLGRFYNRPLNLPSDFAFHKFIAGAAFLFFVAATRLILSGTISPFGYVGIAILWGIFCLFSWLGQTKSRRLERKLLRRKSV